MMVLDVLKWLVALVFLAAAIAVRYVFADIGTLYQALAVIGLMVAGVGVAFTTAKGQEFWALLQEANKERRRVVWPTGVETRQTTIVVVIVVFIAGFVLWAMDMGLGALIRLIIG